MSFISDEAGATAIEYGLFIGFWGTVLVIFGHELTI